MERHKCKLCFRSFSNGRALGGHMRSHLVTLPLPPKMQYPQLGHRTESASSLSSLEKERESEEKGLVYELRENPRKSFKLVDPELLDAGSVVQDRESETESTRNPTRKRSKRTRKMGVAENQAMRTRKPSSTEPIAKLKPISSVSDTYPEEDVAFCLMMLSRDTWNSDDSDELRLSRTQGKYQGEMYCKKVLRSFQALGDHKTSHKKIKSCFQNREDESLQPRNVGTNNADQKVYECPFCFKVFGSGQALGGHKRSHFLGSTRTTATSSARFGHDSLIDTSSAKFGDSLIDLNLPAPMEDEDFSKLEQPYVATSITIVAQSNVHDDTFHRQPPSIVEEAFVHHKQPTVNCPYVTINQHVQGMNHRP
ncbi:hypothetical protein F0562_012063 [Nyssa sinensis]|uniref:C2H2-type domain-containing protein n=1 Tax=Nyssa sinensis TaxID=561372 RepID=A0A5J4ZRP1_9ASTE|nr:hypothetical protein F0562_012063 [Nyssa sinensis]